MSTRKRHSLSLSSERSSLYISSPRRRTRSARNTIIQIAKHSKDRKLLNHVAALAKRYKIYRKKEDLEKLEALLRSQSSRISRSNSMTSADKDDFIDMLIKVTANNSPVRETHTQILDRFLKK